MFPVTAVITKNDEAKKTTRFSTNFSAVPVLMGILFILVNKKIFPLLQTFLYYLYLRVGDVFLVPRKLLDVSLSHSPVVPLFGLVKASESSMFRSVDNQ